MGGPHRRWRNLYVISTAALVASCQICPHGTRRLVGSPATLENTRPAGIAARRASPGAGVRASPIDLQLGLHHVALIERTERAIRRGLLARRRRQARRAAASRSAPPRRRRGGRRPAAGERRSRGLGAAAGGGSRRLGMVAPPPASRPGAPGPSVARRTDRSRHARRIHQRAARFNRRRPFGEPLVRPVPPRSP